MAVKPLGIDYHELFHKAKPVYADDVHPNGFPCSKCGAMMRRLTGPTRLTGPIAGVCSTWTCDYCNREVDRRGIERVRLQNDMLIRELLSQGDRGGNDPRGFPQDALCADSREFYRCPGCLYAMVAVKGMTHLCPICDSEMRVVAEGDYIAEQERFKRESRREARHNELVVELGRLRSVLGTALELVADAMGHLGAARMQIVDSDDQIIAGHVRDAERLATEAWCALNQRTKEGPDGGSRTG